jgi:hypothetical protein
MFAARVPALRPPDGLKDPSTSLEGSIVDRFEDVQLCGKFVQGHWCDSMLVSPNLPNAAHHPEAKPARCMRSFGEILDTCADGQ